MATQSAEGSTTTGHAGEGEGVRRRDFLNVAAVSFAGVGTVAALAPLLVQMAPSADVLALATTEIDISKVQPGQGIKTQWRKQPVFVRNLTPKEIAEADAVAMGENKGPYGGYFCPCHGSMYDTAARIRQGPAPKNLTVPDYNFLSTTNVQNS